MADIYEKITGLCETKGISGSRMCLDLGLSRSFLTELKKGRAKSMKLVTATLVAKYFGVPVDYFSESPEGFPESGGETELSIDERADQILSGLTGNGDVTLMLDGKPASPEAVKAFENAVMVGIELARRVNREREE